MCTERVIKTFQTQLLRSFVTTQDVTTAEMASMINPSVFASWDGVLMQTMKPAQVCLSIHSKPNTNSVSAYISLRFMCTESCGGWGKNLSS